MTMPAPQNEQMNNSEVQTSSAKPNARKRFPINNPAQSQLVRRVVGYFAFFILMGSALGLLMQFFSDPFLSLREQLQRMWTSQGPYLAVLVCMAPIFIYDMIKTSNRIAGPIHRLRQSINQLRNDDRVVPVNIRKDDFWHELMDDYNQLVEHLTSGKDDAISTADVKAKKMKQDVDHLLEAISSH